MEISEIKQRLSIKSVLHYYGVEVDRHNMARCPFHEDKNPSLQLYPQTNTYCCFSSNCHAGVGDQIQFIELQEKQGKHQALLKAKELLGVKSDTLTPLFSKLCQNVKRSRKAQQYIHSRNLRLQNLEIGFNANGYPHLKNCIIFALKDHLGNTVSLYGRSLDKGHYYTTHRQGLYPSYPTSTTRHLVLTESIIDAATLLQERAITTQCAILALYGTNGLSKEHLQAIESLSGLEEITLWLDGDQAGRAAQEKHAKSLHQSYPHLKISGVDTMDGEDINSISQGHDASIFTALLKDRKPLVGNSTAETAAPLYPSEAADKNNPPVDRPRLDTSKESYITYQKGVLRCTLLGGISHHQIDRLRVTLLLERVPKLSALQSIRQSGLDLYHDCFVEKFIRTAAEKLEVGTSELRLTLAELTEALEHYRQEKIEGKQVTQVQRRKLSSAQRADALAYLTAPKLLKRTGEDIGKSGVVGEEINRLFMYIAFSSRKRDMPLHIISLGASGTGKTYLQEKIAELIPEEDIIAITILSDNAFYYFKKRELQHKLILIEDMDGAENVLLPLRELMSKKRISKRVVVKNSQGNMSTISLQVEGPICVAGTTTREQVYEDNANRSLLLYRDNSLQQQEKIMDYQRRTSAGKLNKAREAEIKERFKDMQHLLKPVKVVNPYAEQLKIPQEVFKPLRSNAHYLQFIECVTFYHQYQRPFISDPHSGESYIETSLEDIAAANVLLKEVLLSKSDELSGACRKFFETLKGHLQKENKRSFYAKQIRSALRIRPTTLKRYLYQLHANDYLKIVGGDKFRKGYEYEVLNYEEYQALEDNIKTALDKALDNIKKERISTSVVQ